MSSQPDGFHLRVARIALAVVREHGFALGGGLALVAHGVLDRPTEDIDLFGDVEGSVPAATELVVTALRGAGIEVEPVEPDGGLAAGLDELMMELTAYRDPDDQDGVPLSLSLLHRTRAPVVLDVGPVLHIDDLRAWKVAALVARAEHRDLIDVGAFLATHTPDELLAMARRVDPAIDDTEIAAVGRRVDEVPDSRFAAYGLDEAAVAELRRRFASWPRP